MNLSEFVCNLLVLTCLLLIYRSLRSTQAELVALKECAQPNRSSASVPVKEPKSDLEQDRDNWKAIAQKCIKERDDVRNEREALEDEAIRKELIEKDPTFAALNRVDRNAFRKDIQESVDTIKKRMAAYEFAHHCDSQTYRDDSHTLKTLLDVLSASLEVHERLIVLEKRECGRTDGHHYNYGFCTRCVLNGWEVC